MFTLIAKPIIIKEIPISLTISSLRTEIKLSWYVDIIIRIAPEITERIANMIIFNLALLRLSLFEFTHHHTNLKLTKAYIYIYISNVHYT